MLSIIAEKNKIFSIFFNLPIYISCQHRMPEVYKGINMNRDEHKQLYEVFLVHENYFFNFTLHKNKTEDNKFYVYIDSVINLMNYNTKETNNFIENFSKTILDNKKMLANLDHNFIKILLKKKLEGIKLILIEDKMILKRYLNMLFLDGDDISNELSTGMCLEINQKVYRKLIRLIYEH